MNPIKKIALAALAIFGLTLFQAPNAAAQPEVKFSGFILLNAQYNDGHPANPEIVTAAKSGERGNFLLTPRQSRFVVSISSKEVRWSPSAKIEMDFWGLHSGAGAGGVTQTSPRLRLAYFQIQPRANVNLIFGQSWILFAPLNPTSLAHQSIPANTTAGNLWARLPMLRLDVKAKKFEIGLALNRPHGGDLSGATGQSDLLGAGEMSGLPFVQSRIAATFGKSTIGVSGHYGKLDFRTNGTGRVNSQAVAGDIALNFGKVSVMGEYFTAKNVGMLFSNIKASVANGNVNSLAGQGGWGQICLHASSQIALNIGAGTEEPENGTANTQLFGNLMFIPEQPLVFALEAGQTKTRSAGVAEKNLGVNLGCQYKF